VRPRRRFAQHFLEPPWVAKLVDAIAPRPDDRILEIGPGLGALTLPLARRVGRVLAVEIDRDLAAALAARALPNVAVVIGDILDLDVDALVAEQLMTPDEAAAPEALPGIRVVGNLPYYISSPILFRLLDAARAGCLRDATLMVQREVADRLVARPGSADYGALTVGVALRADVRLLLNLPPGAFRPPPKVRSAVVRLEFRAPPAEIRDPALVTEVVRSTFTQRRKTLANALAAIASSTGSAARDLLNAAGIDPRRRAETLSLQEFGRLADAVATARREAMDP
jgi:16S rRNA (adenine1518-N6/adenine1519-N6)-dimethyltransferase